MKRAVIGKIAALLVRYPWLVLAALVALGALSLMATARLEIESNQIKLIDQELIAVKELKIISEMIGGTGFLMVPLKSDDEARLKQSADTLAEKIRAMPEVRYVTYKVDTTFIRKHIAYFLDPDELETVRVYAPYLLRQIRREIKKASDPLYVDLYEAGEKEKALAKKVDDIAEKYRAMGKKGIDDDYYISRDKKMLLLLVKPKGAATDLETTRDIVARLDKLFADFSASEEAARIGVRMEQGSAFDPIPPKEGRATITYGYTGGYKLNLDDSDAIKQSLGPTSVISAIGIITILMIFLRRASLVFVLVFGLALGVLYTFGFTYVVIGRLNVVTAMLGGILSGLGIDYGIHFLYRLREEYGRTGGDLETSIHETIVHCGSAAATSAATTAGAFFCLMIGRFQGFTHFGLLAGAGLLIVAITLYLTIPLIFLVMARVRPGLLDKLLLRPMPHAFDGVYGAHEGGHLPFARTVLVASVLLTVGAGLLVSRVQFDYDSRSLMEPDRESIRLQGEINQRFKISSDPVAIRTTTIEETRKLYASICGDKATSLPKDRERFPSVDGVISIFSFLPPEEQQKANEPILARLKQETEKDFKRIDTSLLPEDQRKLFDLAVGALDAKPFRLEDMPPHYVQQFTAVPESRHQGWVTFIYPIVSLWDGRDLFRFADEVREVRTDDGQVLYSTGMAIIYAYLARIVMEDGWRSVGLTAVLILIIVFFDFRSLSGALLALIPLLAGMVWMLGALPLLGTKINFMNLVIFPLILGYGINNGVYLYHRFVESGSAAVAVRRSSGPIAASMLTTIAGFGALLYADHGGIKSIGKLACVGLVTALLVALTLMPALLQVVGDRRAARATKRGGGGDGAGGPGGNGAAGKEPAGASA